MASDHRLALGDWVTFDIKTELEILCLIQTEILWSPVKTNCPTERRKGDASSTRTQDTFDNDDDGQKSDGNGNEDDIGDSDSDRSM